MSITEFLSEIRSLDINLYTENGLLKINAPEGALTAGLRDELKKRKWEIIAFLEKAGKKADAPLQKMPPGERNGKIPLSFSQQRLWFLDQLEPGNPFYNIPAAIRLTGQISKSALEKSLNSLTERHESLRTTFQLDGDRPVQVVGGFAPVPLPVVDLQSYPAEQREKQALALVNREARLPFQLARGPLFRFQLLQLTAEEAILLINMHHIVSDGWSVGILVRELTALYRACLEKRSCALPAMQFQYADFAYWQNRQLQGTALAAQLEYWKRQLGGVLPLLEMPTDKPRPLQPSPAGAIKSFSLPERLSSGLVSLCSGEGATLFMGLLSALSILLFRYTGQDEIVIGSPIANRTRPEWEDLIGLFINTLALRIKADGNPTYRGFLHQVQAVTLNAYANQDIPFEKLVEELKPERHMNRTPLFQVLFILQNAPRPALELPGLKLEQLELHNGTAKYDFTLFTRVEHGRITGTFEYNSHLFREQSIERLIRHFEILLEGIVQNRDEKIFCLPLLAAEEKHQILHSWNNTDAAFPGQRPVHHRIEAYAEKIPGVIAVTDGSTSYTYGELDKKANRLANYLGNRYAVKPGSFVGVCLERSADFVVCLLGILKAGAAFVPMEPEWPENRIAHILTECRIPVLITRKQTAAGFSTLEAKQLYIDADKEEIDRAGELPVASTFSPAQAAYVLFTSGTTGKPKGVIIEHSQLCNYLDAVIEKTQWPGGMSYAMVTTFAADLGYTCLYAALCTGGCLHIIPRELAADAEALCSYFSAHPVDVMKLVPSHLDALLTAHQPGLLVPRKSIMLAGEPVGWHLVKKFHMLAPRCPVFISYGPTEAAISATLYSINPGEIDAQLQAGATIVPPGRPLANIQTYILDRYLQPVPPGVTGEIYIGGKGIARGYTGNSRLTEEKFIPDPFRPGKGARLYRTGDLARFRVDGVIEFIRRVDNQVKIRGFRVELDEIGAALKQHPAVHSAVVILDAPPGEAGRIIAYIVPQAGKSADAAGYTAFLRSYLPEYMLPACFIPIPAIPVTSNGKIDRAALPRPAAVDRETAQPETFAAPANDTEKELTLVWEELLAVKPIGADKNFFALGGHSLLAIRLMSRIRKSFNRQLPVISLFQNPTIRQLAALLGTPPAAASLSSQPVVLNRGNPGATPLFFIHPGIGGVECYLELAHCLNPALPFYAIPQQGMDGEQPPAHSIEEMAGNYLALILEIQPREPYCIGGLSMGGAVALEILHQLSTSGREPGWLFMLDTFAPGTAGQTFSVDSLEFLFEFGLGTGLPVEQLLPLVDTERLEALAPDERLESVLARGIESNVLSSDISIAQFRNQFALAKNNALALRQYAPPQYTGHTVFIAAEEHTQPGEDLLGWKPFLKGMVKLHKNPGNHFSMIKRPFVLQLAEVITLYINGISGR